MLYPVHETKGRYFNRYGQRISRSVYEMLQDCNRAHAAVLSAARDAARGVA